LADDLAFTAHGTRTFLNSVQAEVFAGLIASQRDGWVKPSTFIRDIQIDLIFCDVQT
jgi:hypothetical protein